MGVSLVNFSLSLVNWKEFDCTTNIYFLVSEFVLDISLCSLLFSFHYYTVQSGFRRFRQFSPNWPTGPIRSSSCDVHIYIYGWIYLSPFHVNFSEASHQNSEEVHNLTFSNDQIPGGNKKCYKPLW